MYEKLTKFSKGNETASKYIEMMFLYTVRTDSKTENTLLKRLYQLRRYWKQKELWFEYMHVTEWLKEHYLRIHDRGQLDKNDKRSASIFKN